MYSSLNTPVQRTILLVDDEVLFLTSLKEALTRHFPNLAFLCASNGAAAVEALDSHPVHLVVTDIKMPVMNGFDLLSRMASSHPGVPAIVMTAFNTDVIEQRILSAGAIRCLDKPVELELLVKQIQAVLEPETQGQLRGVSLPSFLQLLAMERLTGTLKVSWADGVARLFLRDGQLVHAESHGEVGVAVALRTVALVRVELELRQQHHQAPRTIAMSLTELLLESARLNDEGSNEATAAELDEAFSELGGGDSLPLDPAPDSRKPRDDASLAFEPASAARAMLEAAMAIDGALGVALVDSETRVALDWLRADASIRIAEMAVGNVDVVRAKLATLISLGLKEIVEDIIVTLGRQYHVIRTFTRRPALFVYIALDRASANLGMARHVLSEIERRFFIAQSLLTGT
ncbi:MAG: response regulator [Myxococcales bacterium]|nr:response regulator [Myxococcales bacterium]